jgi:hypothetical protein
MVSFRAHHRLIDNGQNDGERNNEDRDRSDKRPSAHIFPPTR